MKAIRFFVIVCSCFLLGTLLNTCAHKDSEPVPGTSIDQNDPDKPDGPINPNDPNQVCMGSSAGLDLEPASRKKDGMWIYNSK